ncbi:MAG TPA: hypothetical protein ENJ75_02965 [Candidatus Kaiserbacteria bacterium]|nr:hypothetical protein [Candidatus Kaiserbacteria bacterium]
MDKKEKLFRKISAKDRLFLSKIISQLTNGHKIGLNITKVKDTDFFKLRKGNFRIIFHYEKGKVLIIDSIRLRNEKTYKNL